jgi:hypothetical protein
MPVTLLASEPDLNKPTQQRRMEEVSDLLLNLLVAASGSSSRITQKRLLAAFFLPFFPDRQENGVLRLLVLGSAAQGVRVSRCQKQFTQNSQI